jgi:hypothetical protein
MTIIGIDCGKISGYAVIFASSKTVSLLEGGLLPICGEGRKGLIVGARAFLDVALHKWPKAEVVLSEIIQMRGVPTDHAAVEVQGVCRLDARIGYHPATIHSQLGTHKKQDTRVLMSRILGGIKLHNHCADAAAAAICHALKLNAVSLRIDLRGEPEKRKRRRVEAVPEIGHTVTVERAAELLKSGRARVKRRAGI